MLINLKVKTLDARTHEFSIDNEITIRQFKDQIAEKTNIAAENQRIIYQGRVLADEKQVKEFDVDGKVLHVAERPPFSQRGANARNNDEPMRTFRSGGRPPTGMRTSPYFRALDGMLVGTMAIPVNNGPVPGTRTPPNRYPNSSSFCINRITVATHMIDCAANIAAYLENPAVGLNNQSLDILQRGRWSMESTVVEVGVSSTDMPRNNNIIDMVQDAVTAALTRNGTRNYTVLQLPTVYTNESGETSQQPHEVPSGEAPSAGAENEVVAAAAGSGAGGVGGGETTAAAVIFEDVIDSDDEAADGGSDRSDRSSTPTPATDADGAVGGAAASASASEDAAAAVAAAMAAAERVAAEVAPGGRAGGSAEGAGSSGRRRTRPQVLAQVIQHYRSTQTRLAPFVDRYYEILQSDPTFEESDTAGREDAQRIFDRVSEAFHYLSHAQHAISDLMLDLSQPGPRVLTCRPILVEQSGYIRSNNIFGPNFLAPSPGLLNEVALRAGAPAAAAASPAAGSTAARAATAATAAAATVPRLGALPNADAATQAATEVSRSAAAMAQMASQAAGTAADLASRVAGTAAELAAEAANAAAAAAGLAALASDRVEDPVDEPMVAPNAAPGGAQQGHQPRHQEMDHDQSPEQASDPSPDRDAPAAPPRLRVYLPVTLPPPNPQLEMARLIQAVVNRANNEATDVHVEFNSPNIMSINLPVHVMTAAVRPAAAPAAGAAPASAPAASGQEASADNAAGDVAAPASTSGGARSGEQRANTLPTTSTQTRSTSRPQIQIGSNNWGSRIAPTHTAFDRFLPCNSHHIREPEPQHNNNNNNNGTATGRNHNHNHNRNNTTALLGGAVLVSPTTVSAGGRPVTSDRIHRVGRNVRQTWAGSQRVPGAQVNSLRAAAWAQAISHLHLQSIPLSQTPHPHPNPNSIQTHFHVGGGSTSGAVSLAGILRRSGGTLLALRNRFASAVPPTSTPRTAPGGGGSTNVGSLATSRRARIQTLAHRQRLARQYPNLFANFVYNNVRNNAQIASAGRAAVTAEDGSTASAGRAAAPAAPPAPTPPAPAPSSSVAGPPTQAAETVATSAPLSLSAAGDVESSNLRSQLLSFLDARLFAGAPINEQTIEHAIERALEWMEEILVYLPQYERPEFNSRDSVCNMLRGNLRQIIMCIAYPGEGGSAQFERRLKGIFDIFRTRVITVLFLCLGSANADLYFSQLMRFLHTPLVANFRNEALDFLRIYVDPVPPVETDCNFSTGYLVFRRNQTAPDSATTEQPDTDVEMADAGASSSNATSAANESPSDAPALPTVIVGSEPWHASFPDFWLPVITRDLQTQTEENRPQPPFSDAYISGMSAKRRKIIQSDKPTPNVECMIANGVQRAIQNAGLGAANGSSASSSINTDAVIGSIAHDTAIQASYTDAVRSGLRERIKQDVDYKPSKYPQIAKFAEQK